MSTFILADISHTSQRLASEYVPYAIGCLKSYFHEHGKHDADIKLIKYPEKLSDAFMTHRPTLVGFSNYMWNFDLSYSFAQRIKKLSPETLIVFGGRNYPLETDLQEVWLKERPAIDIYLIGDGEEPFQQAADLWLETQSIDSVKQANIEGLHSIVDGKLHKSGNTGRDGYDQEPRISDLNSIPSPYLMGYLDEFLIDPQMSPLIETNRGCPFSCTFCVDGVTSRNKMYEFETPRLVEELEYIAKHCPGKYLQIADTNFGMFEKNIDFCRAIATVKEKYDFPHHIQVCTGKNRQERIIECAELLEGSLRFGVSAQTLDVDVLKNIKRSNISLDALLAVSNRVSNTQASTYSELILALPGDSKEKHLKSIDGLIGAGLNRLALLTLIMLEGSELATKQQRQQFDIKTRYRVVHRSFGTYEFNGEPFTSAEIEEVCVENNTLPFQDYVECRRYALTVGLFYNDKIFFELTQFIKHLGYDVAEWVAFVHNCYEEYPEKLKQIYDQYTQDTINEVSASKEELESRVKNEPGVIDRYISGELGNNLWFNTQAKAYLEAMDTLHDVAFVAAKKFLALREHSIIREYDDYLDELRRYSLNKKRDINRVDEVIVEQFNYDFVAQEADFFDSVPNTTTPTTIRFFYTEQQQQFFKDNVKKHGTSLQAIGKMFSRIAMKKLQRVTATDTEEHPYQVVGRVRQEGNWEWNR